VVAQMDALITNEGSLREIALWKSNALCSFRPRGPGGGGGGKFGGICNVPSAGG
jgi:hypothetical protein